jgi:thiol:disulfide interchange protein/DsbC/DsbD-like thiol-disulfide interchange protein
MVNPLSLSPETAGEKIALARGGASHEGGFKPLPSMNFGRRPILSYAFLFLVSAALLLWPVAGRAFDPFGRKQVTPSLVADTTAIVAGKPFTVGVRLQMEPGWHIYWDFPGDAGGRPSVEWQLPEGFKAGAIQWPIPHSRMDDDLLSYIYETDVVLPVEITPPAELPAGEVALKAHVRWLVCEKTCVPGQGDVEVSLPSGGDAAPANAELFAKWRAQLPKSSAPPFQARWDVAKPDQFSLRIEGAPVGATLEFFPLPPEGATPGHPVIGEAAADGSRTITVPISNGGAPNLAWRGVLSIAKSDGEREGWLLKAQDSGTAAPTVAKPASEAQKPESGPSPTGAAPQAPVSSSTVSKAATAAPQSSAGGLALKLLAAFLGGLIMNVMPCVLPVIALKIFGFVHQAGEAPGRVFRLGLAFNAGVFAFFLCLAAAVARLKTAFNFGYQFQNPYILAGLIALVFVFGLSLIGVFELTLTSGTASKLSELSGREGYGGAFLHGMFTTLLGTSCTAPFLGTSLGFAVTQSTPVIFLLFLAIAAGMSLPYFLLTARPSWMRFLPKPGIWMERLKQLMGFAMLAVAVWLFGVLGLRGPQVVAGMSWFLLSLGLASWLFGLMHGPLLTRLTVLLLPVAGYWFFLHGKLAAPFVSPGGALQNAADGIPWEPYSEERLAGALAKGEPVFVDFTAAWCVNCHVYEAAVVETEAVRAKFREKKIVALKADWTNTDDPVVTRALKSFGAVGVPLYVLYRPGEVQPVVHDALTKGLLLSELDKIKDGSVAINPR